MWPPAIVRPAILALTVSVCFGGSARAAPLHCPPTLKVEQRVTEVPVGLSAFDSESRHGWTNAQFSDGPPDERAWLAPDRTVRNGRSFTNVWTFGKSPAGTWLACAYDGTSMIVASRLSDGITRCEISYDSNVTPPTARSIDCR